MILGLFKKKQPTAFRLSEENAEMVRVAKAAVDAYDEYLEHNPIGYEIRDVAKLPGPKDALINAVRVELMFEQDESVRQFLTEIGLKLALFREGIGEKELSPMGVPLDQLDPRNVPDDELADRVLAAGRSPDRARHEDLMPAVSAEWRELATLFDKSIAIAKKVGA
ncbi:hypothetical protein FJ955_02080 [Mesorhizobium sp. B2-2-2]|uniref:hypothetical protein n=1 Tax=Mesorhizobium sp. B2-2-2 TaxID=2589964 RepID=UPI00112C720B|nr:hypothetical protein [Mesorhizobium sp. B2-2-2]TPM33560.1 hypothetical protein FJ955_02080 [Mesorhizobium sp. B2-2-2]